MNQVVRPAPALDKLLSPYRLGALDLPNRLVMAPLTRNRAGAGNVPTRLMAEYYAQRASAGLLISEATQVSPDGQGYEATPGIHLQEQIEGWREELGASFATRRQSRSYRPHL